MVGNALNIQEVLEGGGYLLNEAIGQKPEFLMEHGIVPGEDLVYKRIAVALQTAGSRRDSYTQRERVLFRNLGRKRKDDSAFEPRLTKFGRLDGQAGTLLAWLCPDSRLQVDDVKMPAAREQVQILFILECD